MLSRYLDLFRKFRAASEAKPEGASSLGMNRAARELAAQAAPEFRALPKLVEAFEPGGIFADMPEGKKAMMLETAALAIAQNNIEREAATRGVDCSKERAEATQEMARLAVRHRDQWLPR